MTYPDDTAQTTADADAANMEDDQSNPLIIAFIAAVGVFVLFVTIPVIVLKIHHKKLYEY